MLYKRVLLKLSGEVLGLNKEGTSRGGINVGMLSGVAKDIREVVSAGVQMGIVLGGGNWFRGAEGEMMGLERVTADQIGMLATLMNALIVQEALARVRLEVKILSAIPVMHMVEAFDWKKAHQYLAKGKVIIFAGGTGHPFVSTDSAASLRALEMKADVLLKATSVDGVYSADPSKEPEATLYTHVSYNQVIREELEVMDLAAFIQCRKHNLPIRIFNVCTANSLVDIIRGKAIGTLISE